MRLISNTEYGTLEILLKNLYKETLNADDTIPE
jgi:hypothetical protein